jgi:predicted enzyme related to lactoylglutathione lyase
MKVVSFRSWNFHANNLDAMTNFYRDVLGAELRTTHTVRGVKVTRLRLGGAGLGLFDASEQQAEGVPHHTFEIEAPRDPNELVREIERKGVKVQEVRLHGDGPGYSVYVNDPTGNRLELSVDFN